MKVCAMFLLHYNLRLANDFASLLELYPDKELPKLTRSTVPLLAYWKDYEPRTTKLLTHLGCGAPDSARLHFEFTVSSAKIRGTDRSNPASQTDLMLFSDGVAVAIEAKWTEPRYETLGSWLGLNPSANRLQVVKHWLGLIGAKIERALDPGDFHGVVNQMVHRTASACHGAANNAVVIYQCFASEEAKVQELFVDLKDFHARLGKPPKLRFYVLHTAADRTQDFDALLEGMKQSVLPASAVIRNALKREGLFRFENECLLAI
jgi:hypothetical protein